MKKNKPNENGVQEMTKKILHSNEIKSLDHSYSKDTNPKKSKNTNE